MKATYELWDFAMMFTVAVFVTCVLVPLSPISFLVHTLAGIRSLSRSNSRLSIDLSVGHINAEAKASGACLRTWRPYRILALTIRP